MRATIEQAIEAIAELLTATHDHGSWKPEVLISYQGPNCWYVALAKYAKGFPVQSVIFSCKAKTLREGLKAAAEFLAPTKLDELKARVQALAEKL